MTNNPLLYLLQFASPALPVGAYSYSEGLEVLVEQGAIASAENLRHWIQQELHYGAIRLEAAIVVRAWHAVTDGNLTALNYWNDWGSAAKETEELRQQSWQMGRAFSRLLVDLEPDLQPWFQASGIPCNYAIAFGIAAAYWQIPLSDSILGYLHSWATHLITAGIKLIPLGQTTGQKLLFQLHSDFLTATAEILTLGDDQLATCNWGLTLASMAHETQYTRLFRS